MNQRQRTTAITLATLVLIIWAGIGALLWRTLSNPQSDVTTIANNGEPTATPTPLVSTPETKAKITLSKAEPTATLFPRITRQPTDSVEPTPTDTLEPTNTAEPTSTATALATVTPTSTAIASPTVSPTATPPPATATSSPTINPTATPLPATATVAPTSTATPTATASPTATATPEPKSALTITDLLALLLPGSADTITIVEDEASIASQTSFSPETSERYILVDQDQQVMLVYEDGEPVRNIPVSTGRPVTDSFTPAWEGAVGDYWGGGPFLNSDFLSDYMWYLFPGDGGSILIHSLPYTLNGEQKIYDRPDALGVEPASRGCVRISPEDAAWLKQWNPVDVAIKITPWSGKIYPADVAQVETEISQIP